MLDCSYSESGGLKSIAACSACRATEGTRALLGRCSSGAKLGSARSRSSANWSRPGPVARGVCLRHKTHGRMIRFLAGSDGPEPFSPLSAPVDRQPHLRTLFIQTSSQPCRAFPSLVRACPWLRKSDLWNPTRAEKSHLDREVDVRNGQTWFATPSGGLVFCTGLRSLLFHSREASDDTCATAKGRGLDILEETGVFWPVCATACHQDK